MSLPVRLSAGAQHDVEDTVAWYEGQRLGLRERFVAALDRLLDRVSENPQQFPVIETKVRRALVRQFPYAVYFVVSSDHIAVIAVLHVRRYRQEWQRRR